MVQIISNFVSSEGRSILIVFYGIDQRMIFLNRRKMSSEDPRKKTKTYSQRRVLGVRVVYVLASLLWIGVIWSLHLYQTTFLGWVILILPLILFTMGFINAPYLTVEVEDSLFSIGYLSIALVIVLPIMVWITKDFTGDQNRIMGILLLAIVFAMLSLYDIWVRPKWLTVARHLKSVFQTLALTLLIFALYTYYLGRNFSLGSLTSTLMPSDV